TSLVLIRAGAETRFFDANANFAYELLISINKKSVIRVETRHAKTRQLCYARATWKGFQRQVPLACDSCVARVASPHEKIGASPAALAAFPSFAKSCPRDAIERPRFCSASVRKRKTGSTPAHWQYAGSFSVAGRTNCR